MSYLLLAPPEGGISKIPLPFFLGIVLAALGGYLVTRYKPPPPKGAHAAPVPAAPSPDLKH